MGRIATFKQGTEEMAGKLVHAAERAAELRRLQSVLFGCKGLSAAAIKVVTGLSTSYIRQIWMQCRKEGIASLCGEKRGQSRGKAHLTIAAEQRLLQGFRKKAEGGQLVTTKEIHAKHAKKVGKPIDPTVTYRLLRRHKWRKVMPRPEHPQHNPEAMKYFKAAIFPPGFDPY